MRTARIVSIALAVAATLALVAPARSARAQTPSPSLTKVTLAVPSLGSYLAFGFVAKDEGFWKQRGLDVDITLVAGTAALQALTTGDVQFSISSGPEMIVAVGRGAKVITIAQLFDRLNYQIILAKKVADKTGLDVKSSSPAQRAAALKGLNIAIGAVGGPGDAFLTHVLTQGGLDPQKDVTRGVVPNSPAQNQALESGRIDALSGAAPYATIAIRNGSGVDWIDGTHDDLPLMDPFVYSVIAANPEYCQKNSEICRNMVAGAQEAVAFMKANRQKGAGVVASNLKNADPSILQDDYDKLLAIMPPALGMNPKGWANTQDFDVEIGTLAATQKKASLAGYAYTDAYLK